MDYQNIRQHMITYDDGADQNVYTKAEGIIFTSETGEEYLNVNDISCVLGYGHPQFTKTIADSAWSKTLAHTGILSRDKEQMIANFMQVTGGDFEKVFFAGSGGEVVDWSVKVARRSTGKDGIISFVNALHGRSFAGAYLSGIDKRKAGFGTGLEHVYFWEYPGDGRCQEPMAETYAADEIAAVIIEPYQALGGMVTPSKEYWQWLRQYTKENHIVLIFDEIQTGFGKTGTFFAYEETGIVPDILLAGKGMSNGFGLGAMLMTAEVAKQVKAHELSGGSADNDFMCSMVNAVFDIFKEEEILEHVKDMGTRLRSELEAVLPEGGKIHGAGLFMSMELSLEEAIRVVAQAKELGVLLGRSDNKILFRPPLVITQEEICQVGQVLRQIL